MRKRSPLRLETLEDRTLLAVDLALALAFNFVPRSYSIDGAGNNTAHPTWGAVNTQLLRTTTVAYGDGISTPAGDDRPNPRDISNGVVAQDDSILNSRHLSDFAWVWGQFLDHDLDLTTAATPAESLPIDIPSGDAFFDPTGTGTQTMPFSRSLYDSTTGTSTANPRQQLNTITAWIDGSMIYGSDAATASLLRTFQGGKMKTSDGNLLPFALDANGQPTTAFQAGDIRVNENIALTSMHTLWVREHNYWADRIARANPKLTDEQIYQRARSIVIAEVQAITYNEFLPAILGEGAIAAYRGYNREVNPGISNIFSTASFRFGHSLLSPTLLRLNNDGSVATEGNIALRDAFFNPQEVIDNGIDEILRGASTQTAQELDVHIVDDVRNFLFGQPGAGGFDLASLNIQRGRDHGLPSYNQARIDLGLPPVSSFAEITSDPELQQMLQDTYGDVDKIDIWVGGLAEDDLPGSSMGPLLSRVLGDQFRRLRDGDPNWYQRLYSGEMLQQLDRTTLADIIRRNTDTTNLQSNVFFDRSVLFFRMSGRPVTVSIDKDLVKILDAGTRRVLLERPVAEVSGVMIEGQHGRQDQVNAVIATDATPLANGVLFYGGNGPGDRLQVMATPGQDNIVVDGRKVTVNGVVLQVQDVEVVSLQQHRRQDNVERRRNPEGGRVEVIPLALPPAPRGQAGPAQGGPNGNPSGQQQAAQVLPERPPQQQNPPVTANAAPTVVRQLFDEVRDDLLRQAKRILSEEQFEVFAAALRRRQEQGPPPGDLTAGS